MKLWCVSFIEFEYIAKENKWDGGVPSNIAIISINNGTYFEGEHHICKDADNVLNLNFDDADPVGYGLPEDTEFYSYNAPGKRSISLGFFTKQMAEKAVKFIENVIENNKLDGVDFYIHCSAGISRSQAFVKYIKNVYDFIDWETNPNNPCLHPNGFVFQKLMQAYRSR